MKLFLIGGFLGSGKSTAITTASMALIQKEKKIAIITNDQGSQLVDTAFARSLEIPNAEVINGCFCCNYQQFRSAMEELNASFHPDIIFAEAVGSCADLVATIVKPLIRFDPDITVVLTVLADGPLLLSSLEGRSSFASPDIQYIYKKQLEEAAILIVNKSDELSDDEIEKINLTLSTDFPDKKLLFQDSRNKHAVARWLELINDETSFTGLKSLDIDYRKYGDGEAALAWLDATVSIHSTAKAASKSLEFVDAMFDAILTRQLAIGHLKFFIQGSDWQEKISFTGRGRSSITHVEAPTINHVAVLVNARIETDPEELKIIFYQSLKTIENDADQVEVLNLEVFRPGFPKPTHRISE